MGIFIQQFDCHHAVICDLPLIQSVITRSHVDEDAESVEHLSHLVSFSFPFPFTQNVMKFLGVIYHDSHPSCGIHHSGLCISHIHYISVLVLYLQNNLVPKINDQHEMVKSYHYVMICPRWIFKIMIACLERMGKVQQNLSS